MLGEIVSAEVCTNGLVQSAVTRKNRSHHDATLATVRQTRWKPTATSADVIELVAKYVRLSEAVRSIRSNAGRVAISESRLSRKALRRKLRAILEECDSQAEGLDAI